MSQYLDVRWVALECRIRQESEDEILGTITRVSTDGTSTIYNFPPGQDATWSMGNTGERIITVDVPLYNGPPTAMSLTATLVEYDSGDIEGYKRHVSDAVSAIASRASGGESEVADSVIRDLSDLLFNSVAELFGVADDQYNPQTLRLSLSSLADASRPRYTLTRDGEPQQAEYTDCIVLTGVDDGGDRGEYALYFDIKLTD
jgi:hypothetical protein